MKQRRRPTRKQKYLIAERGLDPAEWMVFKCPPGEIHLVHRYSYSKRIRVILAG